MPIKALSLYTDKQLIALTTAELFTSTCLEATLQGVTPPAEVFAVEPFGVAFLLKAGANNMAGNAPMLLKPAFDGGLSSESPVPTVVSRFLDPPNKLAFTLIRDAGLARFAAAQLSVPASDKLIQKRDALLAQLGGNTALAQQVWATMETKPWPP
jgi:hypothetical protein